MFALLLVAALAAGAQSVTVVPRGDTANCHAHIVDADGNESDAPCGSPIALPANARAWLTADGTITPYLADVTGGGRVVLGGLTAASTVTFPAGRRLRPGERIRLVSLNEPRDGTALHGLFVRDVTALDQEITMPAGRAVALLLDEKARVLALSRPISLHANAITSIWPEVPEGAAVVARVARPRQDAVALTALDAAGTHAPDVFVAAADALFAVWYALEGNTARLAAASETLHLANETAALRRGSVTTFDESLRVLPALTVTIGAFPDDVHPEPMKLTIARKSDPQAILRTLEVEAARTFTFEHVPAAPLTVALQIGDADLLRSIDLTPGDDATFHVALTPILVSGTVHRGDTPSRATLRFGQKLRVETDEAGRYSILFWQPQRHIVEVLLPELPPYTEMVNVTASMTFDLHIPANAIRVRVYDALDNKPIERGEIAMHSRASGRASVSTIAITSALQQLPPQRAGRTELRVSAPGYADAGPVVVEIDERLREKTIDVPMTRGGESTELVIRLDGVTPAAGAEVGAWEGDQTVWLGKADGEGRIDVPQSLAARRVIIRHPSAASAVVFGAGDGPLSLAPPAPPLLVRVVRRNGDPIGPAAAMLSVRLRGSVRLTGAEAAFATWSLGATSPDGTLLARGLPRNTVRMFATRTATRAQIETGTFDSLATAIDYPWPATANVTLVDE